MWVRHAPASSRAQCERREGVQTRDRSLHARIPPSSGSSRRETCREPTHGNSLTATWNRNSHIGPIQTLEKLLKPTRNASVGVHPVQTLWQAVQEPCLDVDAHKSGTSIKSKWTATWRGQAQSCISTGFEEASEIAPRHSQASSAAR